MPRAALKSHVKKVVLDDGSIQQTTSGYYRNGGWVSKTLVQVFKPGSLYWTTEGLNEADLLKLDELGMLPKKKKILLGLPISTEEWQSYIDRIAAGNEILAERRQITVDSFTVTVKEIETGKTYSHTVRTVYELYRLINSAVDTLRALEWSFNRDPVIVGEIDEGIPRWF